MKDLVSIILEKKNVTGRGLTQATFEELATFFEEDLTQEAIQKVLEKTDPRLDAVFDFLSNHNIPCLDIADFDMGLEGVYLDNYVEVDDQDVEEAEFLICIPSRIKLETKPRPRGKSLSFEASRSKVRKKTKFGCGEYLGSRIFCSPAGKSEILSKGLVGLDFAEVEVHNLATEEERVWELVGKRKLDFFSIGGYLDEDSRVIENYPEEGGCRPNSGLLGSVRYRAEDLASVTDDIFFTKEEFGATDFGRQEMVIVSRRFKKACEELNWKCSWFPVLVDK